LHPLATKIENAGAGKKIRWNIFLFLFLSFGFRGKDFFSPNSGRISTVIGVVPN
jgi:hypothetical protein